MVRSRLTVAVRRVAWVAVYILVALLLTDGNASAGAVSRSPVGHVGTAHVYDDSSQDAFARRDKPARTDPTSQAVPFENALDLTVGAELVQDPSHVAPKTASSGTEITTEYPIDVSDLLFIRFGGG